MRSKFLVGQLFGAVLGVALLLSVVGCSKHQTMDEFKQDRLKHYQQVRSSLFLQAAEQYFETGDLKQAENETLNAMTQDRENPNLHVLLGRIALERNQLERAYKHFEQALEFDDEHAGAYYSRGIVLQRWQRFELALADYQKAYEFQADNVYYLLSVAEMHVATNQRDQAIELLESCLTYFDQNAGIRLALAQLHVMQKEYDLAVQYYREASLLSPDELKIVEDLAFAQLAAGQLEDATANFQRLCALETSRNREDLQLALVRCHVSRKHLSAAKDVLLRLTRFNPRSADAWIKLGEIAWSEGDVSGSLIAASRVISLAPNRHEGYLLSGMVWRKRGKLEQAMRLFKQAAAAAPENATPLILQGITLEQAGQPDKAVEAYLEALRRQPADQRAKRLLVEAQKR